MILLALALLPAGAEELAHPIAPAYISGSFAEYRKYGRYHHGLDYKTFNRNGMAVQMPARGTVKKLQVSEHGYGNALWVETTAGLMTFAHLQDFACDSPDLEYLARGLEFLHPARSLNLSIPPYFTLEKGQCLARSGESGSGAPHLHFEVYNKGYYWNALSLPGLAIGDRSPPELQHVYFQNENSMQKIALVPCKVLPEQKVRSFCPTQRISVEGIGKLFLGAYDTMAARNRNGLYRLELWKSEKLLFRRTLDRITLGEFAQAGEVYNLARTAIGFEYVYLLHTIGTPAISAGDEVRILACDTSDNCAQVALLLEKGKSQNGPPAAFRRFSSGQSFGLASTSGRINFSVDEKSIFGSGLFKLESIAEEDLPATADAYKTTGGGFRLDLADVYFNQGLAGSALFATELSRPGLYFFDPTLQAWRMAARPYEVKKGHAGYSFRFRSEGVFAQLQDVSRPQVRPVFRWMRQPESQLIVRELQLSDQGSGADLSSLRVFFDGHPLDYEWIEDRYVIRLVIAPEIAKSNGSLLVVEFHDHAGNASPIYTEIFE